ncbi:hypothetical protein Q8A67_019710 [Cirrhinus molitorella]|uniref:Uncharacterized protein n=1 Tax=Cirrhinus molitorella TaxID=172907 RepID=A0AA88TDX5_9TELE|nr:hypothetical protein Q8A67_019710 [Cirrhinus molitorella]
MHSTKVSIILNQAILGLGPPVDPQLKKARPQSAPQRSVIDSLTMRIDGVLRDPSLLPVVCPANAPGAWYINAKEGVFVSLTDEAVPLIISRDTFSPHDPCTESRSCDRELMIEQH